MEPVRHPRKETDVTQPSTTTAKTAGWAAGIKAFAGSLLVVIGSFNLIYGFAAVFNDQIWVEGQNRTFLFDLTVWGWVHVVLGALLVLVGIGIFQNASWATIAAAALVMINMVTQMIALPAYPWWSLVVIALDAVILWALLAHGDVRVLDD
jgi:hypothetical protein